jgi:hypothetical protein
LNIFNPNVSVSLVYEHKAKPSQANHHTLFIPLKHHRPLYNLGKIILSLITKFPKDGVQNILFYNFTLYYIPIFVYYRLIRNKKVVVIVADAPFLVGNNILNLLHVKLIKMATGIVTLRKIPELNSAKTRNEVVPGIISQMLFNRINVKKNNTVIMSGSLGLTTGLLLALEFFSTQDKYKLFITGKPYLMTDQVLISHLERYQSDSISYLGVLDYREYIELLSSCQIGLSLRNPADIEHEFNFPSKIIEYISCEAMVITSLDYPELDKSTYMKTEFSISGLQDCFNKIDGMSLLERKIQAENSRKIIYNLCAEDTIKEKIERLLNDC